MCKVIEISSHPKYREWRDPLLGGLTGYEVNAAMNYERGLAQAKRDKEIRDRHYQDQLRKIEDMIRRGKVTV